MKPNMRALGFCGADDSVDPKLLQIISTHYPWVEWGVLFRPDLEGTPRYASSAWVSRLASLQNNATTLPPMKLAAHLCGSRCQDILSGDARFVKDLVKLGFRRVQVNATAANRVVVDPEHTSTYVENILACIRSVPDVEWIFQSNQETKALLAGLLVAAPSNMSILFDASCGLGVPMTEFPKPFDSIPCGYAGGISPANIVQMLARIGDASAGRPVWIDMESSLRRFVRGPDGAETDSFSIDVCFACIQASLPTFEEKQSS
ncbi:hypothetical protein H257_14617 [Aphanomyces astaci]|uniref:Phosphoribosylanthranilate isomerase n=1 Tax=Aphanomyces astaci TaxID=112090 RepID=W4FQN0_APHAT|nr:hypothetical protein H257_14617 [Aphanomyces astaci]ETV69792.1 hypothetical protein H257_14617 [Aphanomyces astaci]RQM22652.1 hypothetical protein B5M09_005405 [Aphanomyces astaci]|eukprot:XP_009840806.1 hypothetical protein H257_14617 [Aphanomyces astaci]